jgi:DNA-binding LacI/PurR family transcriptional regulator
MRKNKTFKCFIDFEYFYVNGGILQAENNVVSVPIDTSGTSVTSVSGDKASLQEQVKNRVAALIQDGTLAPGSVLPPLRELAEQMGTSVTPLQRAIKELAAAGLVEVRPGRGNGVTVLGPRGMSSPPAMVKTIAVLSRTGSHHDASGWKHRMVTALEQQVGIHGHRVVFFNCVSPDGITLRPLEAVVREALDAKPDAIAFVEVGEATSEQFEVLWSRLQQAGCHGVFVMGSSQSAPVNSIYYDNDWGGYLAARLLCEQGHRVIVTPVLPAEAWGEMVLATGGQRWIAERLRGIERACRLYGAQLRTIPLLPTDRETPGEPVALGDWQHWGERFAAHLIEQLRSEAAAVDPALPRPTALIALNDEMAIRSILTLRDAGLRVPEDISIVGFDNQEEGRSFQLSTVESPIEEMGREAGRLLERLIAEDETVPHDAPVQHLLVKPTLIARNSVARQEIAPAVGGTRLTEASSHVMTRMAETSLLRRSRTPASKRATLAVAGQNERTQP